MTGLIMINLGTPDSPSKKDVKEYLDEFLMDERVIDLAYWKRWLLIKGIVLNVRPAKSAEAYQKIWTEKGSPIMVYSRELEKKVNQYIDENVHVELAMRYRNPSIKNALEKLKAKGIKKLVVLPLYPHFAMSSTETVLVKVKEEIKNIGLDCDVDYIESFYNELNYIKNLSSLIQQYIKPEEYDKIIFSYHGIPERHITKTDPTKSHCKIDGSCCDPKHNSPAHAKCYRHQCFETTRLVSEKMNLPEEKVMNAFQSRLGRAEWLKPYTAATLEKLPKQGIKKVAIICPAFVSDCLETIEEMCMEGEEIFLEAGGEKFDVVPCLNDDDEWAKTIASWVNERAFK